MRGKLENQMEKNTEHDTETARWGSGGPLKGHLGVM